MHAPARSDEVSETQTDFLYHDAAYKNILDGSGLL